MTTNRVWRRWFWWATAGEVVGFALPAATGVASWDWSAHWSLVALVAAGTVEGGVLGAAQAHVLAGEVPALRRRAWVGATAAGAALAYLVGMAPATLAGLRGLPPPLLVLLAAVGAVVLLGSIGTAQWLVLRHAIPRSASWVLTTAGAWLAGLAVFMVVATPLWHEGQSPVLAVAIGLGAGLLMAATVAATTGLALCRLLGRADHDSTAMPPAPGESVAA